MHSEGRSISLHLGSGSTDFTGCVAAGGDTLTVLIEAKKLADKLGRVDRAREAVNVLAKLL